MSPEERAQFIEDIRVALSPAPQLSDEEHQWVKLAIQKEAQSIALRRAVIEKSLSSLVWLCIVGIGYILIDFAKAHGFK